MAEKTLIAALVTVNCLAHTNYRRAGMAFSHGENTLQPNSITPTQLAQLQADPRLKVTLADDDGQEGPIKIDLSKAALSQPTGGDGPQKEHLDNGLALTSVESTSKPETLVDAIKQLDRSNAEHFTSSGKPQVDALAELMQTKVTAAERDEAWDSLQEDGPDANDTDKGE